MFPWLLQVYRERRTAEKNNVSEYTANTILHIQYRYESVLKAKIYQMSTRSSDV